MSEKNVSVVVSVDGESYVCTNAAEDRVVELEASLAATAGQAQAFMASESRLMGEVSALTAERDGWRRDYEAASASADDWMGKHEELRRMLVARNVELHNSRAALEAERDKHARDWADRSAYIVRLEKTLAERDALVTNLRADAAVMRDAMKIRAARLNALPEVDDFLFGLLETHSDGHFKARVDDARARIAVAMGREVS